MDTIYIVGLERPTTAPDNSNKPGESIYRDFIICNAPRPIPATITWTGEFISGVFYAAIDPADPYQERFFNECEKLDARALIYFDDPAIFSHIDRWYKKIIQEYNKQDIDALDPADLFDLFQNDFNDKPHARLIAADKNTGKEIITRWKEHNQDTPPPAQPSQPAQPTTPQQETMFTQGQDLPLFSGTPQRAKESVFKPQPVHKQSKLF